MKLKGEVEVFKVMNDGTSHSVLKEGNMVVDGASEVIVDMLTTPLFVKNTTGSASLDTSNFTVNALSMGKAEKLYGGSLEMSAAETNDIGMHSFFNNVNFSAEYFASGPSHDAGNDDWVGQRQTVSNLSSFLPSNRLPKDPTPRDTRLENSSKTQIELYYELSALGDSGYPETGVYARPFGVASGWNNASAIIPNTGHNLNAWYASSTKSPEAMFQGCYAPSDGVDVIIWNSISTKQNASTVSAFSDLLSFVEASTVNVSGRYNTVGSMDQNGYLVAYPLQHHPASGDTTYGVAVSAGTTSTLTSLSYTGGGLLSGSSAFIQSPAVVHTYTVSSSDLLCLAGYKGFTNIGLWALDAAETFKTEAAPVAWSTPTNNRKYKLFAKKVFSEDLTTITDDSGNAGIANYSDLKVEWRMNFSFGETF
jgi:hypothetical protein